MNYDELADTLPGIGSPPIPNNKLRIDIETITLFFSVESRINLFAGDNHIAESKKYSEPPSNKEINLFVTSQILKQRKRLTDLGVNVIQEMKNFST